METERNRFYPDFCLWTSDGCIHGSLYLRSSMFVCYPTTLDKKTGECMVDTCIYLGYLGCFIIDLHHKPEYLSRMGHTIFL